MANIQASSDEDSDYVESPVNWERSPYTYNIPNAKSTRHDDVVDRENGALRRRHVSFTQLDNKTDHQPPVIISSPPIGHYLDFTLDNNDSDVKPQTNNALSQETLGYRDKKIILGKLLALLTLNEKLRIQSQENRTHAVNGAKLVDKIVSVPLSTFWQACLRLWTVSVFAINIIVSLIDIFNKDDNGNYVHLPFKITSFLLILLEITLILFLWLAFRKPSSDENTGSLTVKNQQYIENISQEFLVYILVTISIFSFSTEQMYNKPNSALGWIQLLLLLIDVITIFWTQLVRMYMVYKFTRDVQQVVDPVIDRWRWSHVAGSVLLRAFLTTVGSFIIFLVLALMLMAQVHSDSYESGRYTITFQSAVLVLAFFLMPIISVIVFCMVNAYWCLEILLHINIKVATNVEFQEQLKDRYGEMVSDVIARVLKKVNASKKTLDALQSVIAIKKVFSVTGEWYVIVLICIWEIILLFAVAVFDGCKNTFSCEYLGSAKLAFIVLVVTVNYQVVFVAITVNALIVLFLLVALPLYPIFIPLLFWRPETSFKKTADARVAENN